jgi:hypothetical protein
VNLLTLSWLPLTLAIVGCAGCYCGRHLSNGIADGAAATGDGGSLDGSNGSSCGPWRSFGTPDAGAEGEFLLSQSGNDSAHAADGDFAVYATWDASKLYIHRLSTNEERVFEPPAPYLEAFLPQIAGGRIVALFDYCRDSAACTDVLVIDVATCNARALGLPRSTKRGLKFSGNVIVWEDDRNGSSAYPNVDIYMFDLATDQESPLVTLPGNQQQASIDGRWLAWGEGDKGIGYMNLDDRVIRHAEGPALQEKPSVSGDRVVFVDYRNAFNDNGVRRNADIYMLTLSSGEVRPLVTNPAEQDEPFIFGDLVAYTDTRDGSWDGFIFHNSNIYVTDLRDGTERALVTAPNNQSAAFIWQGGILWQDLRDATPSSWLPRGYWRPR